MNKNIIIQGILVILNTIVGIFNIVYCKIYVDLNTVCNCPPPANNLVSMLKYRVSHGEGYRTFAYVYSKLSIYIVGLLLLVTALYILAIILNKNNENTKYKVIIALSGIITLTASFISSIGLHLAGNDWLINIVIMITLIIIVNTIKILVSRYKENNNI